MYWIFFKILENRMEKYRHITIIITKCVDIPRIHSTLFHGLRENTPSLHVVYMSTKEWPSWLFVRDILQFYMEELSSKCFVLFLLGLLRKESAPVMAVEGVVILCMTNIDRPQNVSQFCNVIESFIAKTIKSLETPGTQLPYYTQGASYLKRLRGRLL